jgi:FlaA1/EpsC-like NDP-sugar epimerase
MGKVIERAYRRNHRFLNRIAFAALVPLALIGAFLLRFEFSVPQNELPSLWTGIGLALAIKLAIFILSGRDRDSWRYVTIFDITKMAVSHVAATAIFAIAGWFIIGPIFPRSVYLIDGLIAFLLEATLRVSIRAYSEVALQDRGTGARKSILIYGSGQAGLAMVREVRSNPALGYSVAGFIDDDSTKHGQTLLGVTVLGTGRQVPLIVDSLRKRGRAIEEIVIAMPSASGGQIREVVANCKASRVPVKRVPGVGELLSGKVLTSQIRSVSVEDLLRREPVRLDVTDIQRSLRGCHVMITGGAGSIGSELCRQIATFEPARLVIFERAESDLYRIEYELRQKYPQLDIVAQIGDIRELDSVDAALEQHQIQSVFHAAAYKHVPMMENHPLEAVANNVIGTWNLADAARRHGVRNFLMISSDKAVNPTNIMGLTKRMAEIIVATAESTTRGTKYVSVRFGNVLGSNGSVVPLFEKQIAAGGPITVTHPEMRRYFMTIPEAVQLVLQASTMGKGSEIFVLDMGQPVKIADLARNMIELSGRQPGTDIEIRFTGLRPGEKLFEELSLEGEQMMTTYHEKIKIFGGAEPDRVQVERCISRLNHYLAQRDDIGALRTMWELVPEYHPDHRWRTLLEATQTPAPGFKGGTMKFEHNV